MPINFLEFLKEGFFIDDLPPERYFVNTEKSFNDNANFFGEDIGAFSGERSKDFYEGMVAAFRFATSVITTNGPDDQYKAAMVMKASVSCAWLRQKAARDGTKG